MTPIEITAAVTALANLLARSLSPAQLALLSSLLVQLGDTLATVLASEALISEMQAEK